MLTPYSTKQAYTICAIKCTSDPILQDIAPSLITIDKILCRPQFAIHEWLQNSASYMQQYIAAAQQSSAQDLRYPQVF